MTILDAKTLDAPVDLTGKHVLVTGASRGIGAAIARELAGSRARVALVSRHLDDVEAVRAALPDAETHAAFEADVTDARAVERMLAAAESRLGPVYALVNNAGAGGAAAFIDADDAHWRAMIDVNLMSAVFCTRAVLAAMQARREGRIINMGSTASLRGYRHVTAYTAAKHAVLGFTRALAREVERDGIRVNAVCPGYTETELLVESIRAASVRTGKTPDEVRARFAASNRGGRLVETRQIARVVMWLCGDAAAGLSGHHVVLEGGDAEVTE
jgi:NAD(P)-dependent dehydrogenase (short-subunit alcohol dehydrogenase family)